jgi:hypothetical protein
MTLAPKPQTISYKNLTLEYSSNNSVVAFWQGTTNIGDIIVPFLNQAKFGPKFAIDSTISKLAQEIFDFAGWILNNKNNPSLSASIVNSLFGWFRLATLNLSAAGAQIASTAVWLRICEEVWKWENANSVKLHKGTPYHFLAEEYLTAGNIDTGFLFVHNAVEEDKRLATLTATPSTYKNCPAYLFASLVDDPNNSLYYMVQEMKHFVVSFINSYTTTFSAFTFNEFDTKFLRNDNLEDAKFVFVYNMYLLVQQSKLPPELSNNDFCRLRNLDILADLGIIIDKVLEQRFGGDMMNANVEALSTLKGWLTTDELAQLKGNLRFKENPTTLIPRLLPLSLTFNGNPVPKELVCTLIALRLRNYGSHTLKSQSIFYTQYSDLIQMIMHALFIAVKELP